MASVSAAILVPLAILAIVGVISLALALRHRLPFRIAMRNVRRGKWRTVLLVFGLLIGTTIISSSLVLGDTINQLAVQGAYQSYGFTDEGIYNQSPTGDYQMFPYSVYTGLSGAVAGDSQIAGIAPEIIGHSQVLDRSNGVPQPNLLLVGVNTNQSSQLGTFTSTSGGPIAGPSPGQALIDVGTANDLGAVTGHVLELYGPNPVTLTVQAVVADDNRGGFLGGGFGGAGTVFVDLATAQKFENSSGMVNFLAVTNAGSITSAVGLSSSVGAKLNQTLSAIPGARGLTVHPLLSEAIVAAAAGGAGLTTLFLVFGLFSIVAGAMLIVGIFVMLAEERKGEMGMVRAIGFRRGQLVSAYYFEGLAYSAGSALLGTLLGVVVGYALTYEFAVLFQAIGLSRAQILASFTIRPESLLLAYVAGFLLTLVTVAATSGRTSRLNIVRAIRSIPEPPPTLRVYTRLAYGGFGVAALGALLFVATYHGTTDISLPLVGGALLILGIALVGSRLLPNRVVFSAAAVALLVWSGYDRLELLALGENHGGGFFVVFTKGILLVLGAILLYIFNSGTVVRAVSRLLGSKPESTAVARVALSYPHRRSGRTAISLTIFALVVFTLVAIASFGASLRANLSSSELNQTGGYTFFGASQRPIPDLAGAITANSTLAPLFSYVVPLISGGIYEGIPGWASDPFGDSVYSAPVGVAAYSDFYATNQFKFSQTWNGWSAQETWTALKSNASYAVLDGNYLATSGGNGGFGNPHPSTSVGTVVPVSNPMTGAKTNVTVIGIMSELSATGVFVGPATASALGYKNESAFFLTVAPGVSADRAAQLLKAAFLPAGLIVFNLGALFETGLGLFEGFVGLLELFVGLGLAVGIASLGIVALRSVQERRSEIGMLRAVGFTQPMVFRAFLIEFSFVTLLGILIGTTLGILLILDLASSPGAAASGVTSVSIPWANIGLIAAVAYGLTILAVLGPSLRAARLAPAEAVRPTE